MSKASNQSKQLKKRHRKQTSRISNATSQTNKPKRFGQSRGGRRGKHKLGERSAASVASSLAVDATSSTANPLVRGELQQIITKSGDRSIISEISREATAGGVIYRLNNPDKLEILLVADRFDRWTIPKGHIEAGETAQETAIREIGEEAGVHELEPICWLGKIHFRYRRSNILVLMSTQIYLFKALGDTDNIKKEDWMNGIKWFGYDDAISVIAYKDIAKLIKLGHHRLCQKGELNDKN